ncbi:MAG: type II toxin-antitoxin system VapC family toxin [archaeon]|nr:type II toxin-antitoxin system VapC family toxin [archaeon]
MAIEGTIEREARSSASSSTLVLDPSAIASIFFPDRFEQLVAQTIRKYDNFSTMDISYAEIGSVAWKSVVIFKQPIDPVNEALRQASEFISDNCNVVSIKEILNEAFQLGTKHKIQIYDTLFLSLARRLRTKVLTTDERLHNKLNGIKALRGITVLPSTSPA